MVVGLALAAIQMGMALPTGFLFGVGYGTGVRIGYEQVYPLLFPKGARPTTTELAATLKGMNTVYDAIGGKDASRMGIAVGITNAGEILNNPDFQVLEKLELISSGHTSSNSNLSNPSEDRDRGSFSQQDTSPEALLHIDIETFNKLTNSEIWTKVRALSTGQILNSRTGTGMSAEWMEITGKVLLERTQAANAKLGTGPQTQVSRPPPEPFKLIDEAKQSVALTWTAKRDTLINDLQYHNSIITRMTQDIAGNPKHRSASKIGKIKNDRRAIKSKLITMSNDYRHPNNFIRTQALILRKLLQTL